MLRGVASRPFIAIGVGLLWAVAMLGYAISTETPVGFISGNVTGADTGEPIPNADVRLFQESNGNGELYSKTTTTDEFGNYKFAQVPEGKYKIESYAKVHSLDPSAVTVREGQREELNLELKPAPSYLNLYIHQQLFTSREVPEVEFDGFTPADEIRLTIYKINPDKVFSSEAGVVREMITDGWGRYSGELEGNPVVAGKQELAARVAGRDKEGTFHQRVSLGKQAPGIYIINASCNGLAQTGWISVSDLAIITKEGGDDLLAYAIRPDTGEPVPGASVKVLEADQPVASGVTGPDGLLLTKPSRRKGAGGVETGRENRLIVGRLGDSVAFLTSHSYEPEANDTSIYAYTDRPVYRPGHTVNFRGIVRRFAGDAYKLPGGGEARVEVRDRRDTLVYSGNLPLGKFGTFHGSFKLPEFAATGGYDVTCVYGGHEQTTYFSVAEYRKPEFSVSVEMPKKRCARGDKIKAKIRASYFFGAPVAGAEVRYTVYRSQYYYWPGNDEYEDYYSYEGGDYYDGEGSGDIVIEGTARTGPDGTAEVEFVAHWPKVDDAYYADDQMFSVSATVTDQSRSEAEGSGSIIATQGAYTLLIEPREYVVEAGKSTSVDVRAVDFDGKPQAGVDVEVSASLGYWSEDGNGDTYEPVASGTVRTNAAGRASFSFKPKEPGSYAIRVRSRDRNGREIRSAEYLWVVGEGQSEIEDYNYPDLEVVLDKKVYNPGDVAKVMINSREKGVWALVTVEGRRLYQYRVTKLDSKSTVVEIPVGRELRPNFYVSVLYANKKKLAQYEARARVSLGEKSIKLTVTPNKRRYEPGETANYLVRAVDDAGKPVVAEVSLGVVDEAIYQIQEDETIPIRDFFYSNQPNSVGTRYSFPNVYLSGDKAAFTGKVRKDFKDTALWRADVVTDSRGEARVSMELPDNLTTWRATARACSADTAVGQCVSSVVCSKKLLVRLETPRFVVQDDQARVSAIVHNYTGRDQSVEVTLRAPGLSTRDRLTRRVSVDSDGMARVEWTVTAPRPGNAKITAYAVAKGAQDAMELTIPVRPRGQRQVETHVGTLTGNTTSERLAIRADSVDGASEIRIRIAPSLASSLIGSLDYLTAYPYGCTEQTMSGFLPDVVIYRMLNSVGIDNPELKQRLPDMVGRGLNRLYDFQNENGGWGWCTYGDEDLWMTSYVLHGLLTARDAGFAVNEDVLSMGTGHLARRVTEQKKATSDLIYATYVLSLAGKGDVARERLGFILKKPVRNSHDLAVVTLTLANLGDAEQARAYLAQLWGKANISDGGIHWSSWRGNWTDETDVETTALAMQAVNRLTPDDPRLPRIMRWIMSRRTYNHWSSTRDTAMVIYAASDYLARTKELAPDYQVTVYNNDVEVAGARFDQASVFAPEHEIVIRPRDVRKGANVITLKKVGTGTLYYTIEATQYIERKGAARTITPSGITVNREYRKFVPRWNESLRYNELKPSDRTGTSFRSGDTLEVRLIVNSPRGYQHVLVEDYLPAGCEAFDRGRVEPWEWTDWWEDMDVRDERVSFYVETLPKGQSTLTYQVRAWLPGRYNALGTLVQAMYQPEVVAVGEETQFDVRD